MQETLARYGGLIGELDELKLAQVCLVRANFARPDFGHRSLAARQLAIDHLAQVHLLVARHDIVRGDVADHARHAHVRRRDLHVCNQNTNKLLLGVGSPRAVSPVFHKTRAVDERARVHFHLVGKEVPVGHERTVSRDVALRRGPVKVGHEVRMDFEAEQPCELEGAPDAIEGDAAQIRIEYVLVKALNSDLNLRCAECPHLGERSGGDAIGARLDDKSHRAMRGLHVARMLEGDVCERGRLAVARLPPARIVPVEFADCLVVGEFAASDPRLLVASKCGKVVSLAFDAALLVEGAPLGDARPLHVCVRCLVQRAEKLAHEPKTVRARIICPGAAEDDELDLVGRVSHVGERAQSQRHLKIGIEPVALGSLAGRLICQIAFRHADVVRAVEAGACAGPRLGEHRYGRHTRCGAHGLHPQGAHEKSLELVVDAPAAPQVGIAFLRLLVEGEEHLLGHRAHGSS